jgi:HEAT repeat protein
LVEGDLGALLRLMPAPAEPFDPGEPGLWPDVERQIGLRLPTDYKAFIGTYGSGRVGEFLNIADPFSDNPYIRDLPQETLQAYRDIRKWEHIPFPIHPEPGGLVPWGDTDNGDVMFWVADPPDEPDRWSIAINEVRSPFWYTYPGPLVRFLCDWITGGPDVVPFISEPLGATFNPATPWIELEARLEAEKAKWRAWPGHPSPPPPPGPGQPDWPPTTTDGWIAVLRDGSHPGRDAAAAYLAGVDDAVMTALIDLLDDQMTAIWAIRAMRGHGTAPVPGLLALLHRRDGQVDWFLAQALGGTHDERVLVPLVNGLASNDPNTRRHAATGLRVLGRAEAIEPLMRTLADTHPLVRRDAVMALGEVAGVGDPEAAAAVEPLLADPHDLVREAAARMYGRLGGAVAVEQLQEMLADGVAGVRAAAIDGLGATGSADAASIVLDRMATLNPRLPVREELGASITALGVLRDERARAPLAAILEADYRDWLPAPGQPTYGELATTALAKLDAPEDP